MMDPEGQKSGQQSQDSKPSAPSGSGTVYFSLDKQTIKLPPTTASPSTTKLTSKGVENAKKRLRAFSIQKKMPITPVPVVKPVSTGNSTVLIGKLSSVKVTPKQEDPAAELKKPPKPPKPGVIRKSLQQDYMVQQKKTQSEIEDMKRKMELVDLGIPLGLICPTSTSDKAMPTKAMPPIKSFLARSVRLYQVRAVNTRGRHATRSRSRLVDAIAAANPAKVDEIILEAKKARAAGIPFKFDYQKLLPGYDNPFQRKREEAGITEGDKKPQDIDRRSKSNNNRRKSDKFDKKHGFIRDVRDKIEDDKDREKSKSRDDKAEVEAKRESRETNVNLNDYLVCDSWSLENDDKNNSSSPKADDKITQIKNIPMPKEPFVDPMDQLKQSLRNTKTDSSKNKIKFKKLQPVMDTFEYEIDPNEDDVLDIFDQESILEKYAKPTTKKDDMYDSPVELKSYDDQNTSKDGSMEGMNDESFLQSVINEIKQEDISDDGSQDKGLVEYDISPPKDEDDNTRGSVTPELKDLHASQRSDYSDGYKSTESGYKSTESGYKSTESYKSSVSGDIRRSFRVSMEKELEALGGNLSRSTVDSLETWSFVLKICQPLLFRHDKNKCYKETRTMPKLWYTESPKLCNCVKDRSVVYEELEMSKMNLVDRVYGCDQISDPSFPTTRTWYPRSVQCLMENTTVQLSAEDDWEAEDSQLEIKKVKERRSMTPQRNEEIYLDREYQRFMQAVLSDVSEHKRDTSRSTTPVTQDTRKKKTEAEDSKRSKKIKLSSEGWSQESDMEEDEKNKKLKVEKEKKKARKRKHSSSSLSDSEDHSSKKKKILKKKDGKKLKSSKSPRSSIRYLKKLKEKKKKKLIKLEKMDEESEEDNVEKEKKKKDKKSKKKKLQKLKRKNQKRKKTKTKSSSSSDSSTSSESSSETDSEVEKRKRKKRKEAKKKKRKQSTSESTQSEDLFDVNILNNIKTEKNTEDDKQAISPRKKPREIINVKELQNDFVGNNIHIKKEVEEEKKEEEKEIKKVEEEEEKKEVEEVKVDEFEGNPELQSSESQDDGKIEEPEFKEPQDPDRTTPQLGPIPDESNLSQSSQDSTLSKDHPIYEKDESHLRPSSQNSNYSFNDVITASHNAYHKEMEDDKFVESYEQGNYEMYEQLAMAYQSDVASQVTSPPCSAREQRIETVVRARSRGEIKCDWRAGDSTAHGHAHRPSRWGLKPGEVNIVLTGGGAEQRGGARPATPAPTAIPIAIPTIPTIPAAPATPQPVYKIQSIANRTDNCNIGYDEAYMDTYGASDRLQYGDCFADAEADADADLAQHMSANLDQHTTSSLDARISQALQNTVLGDVARDTEDSEAEKYGPEKGILVTKTTAVSETVRGAKRVSFADGYKPGQDSDVEERPVKKRKKSRRVGCAWPCPAGHPDHVPLWDALPPPPPPPGSPPPPRAPPPPPLHLLRQHRPSPASLLPTPPHPVTHKFDPNTALPGFMPPEPLSGLISLGPVI